MDLSVFKNHKGVYILSKVDKTFSKEYIALRKKEGRILSNNQVKKLPYISKKNTNYKEWLVRLKTTDRFINYLNTKKQKLDILDIGCGNGWFSNKMAEINNTNVIGLDINLLELEQANECFQRDNLNFIYNDIFVNKVSFNEQFDIITLNASVQYFPDIKLLISTLKQFLKPNGEIHILDSPFYNISQVTNAKQRTLDYYTKIGSPKMANQYFHHTVENLSDFTILYRPKKTILDKILSKKDSPFMWLIKK